MNVKKLMSKTAIVAVSIGLVAVSAHAGPPRDSGKDVIGEAWQSCGITDELGEPTGTFVPAADLGQKTDPEIKAFACTVLYKTDGERDGTTRGCTADATTNGYVSYSDRNCEKNEAALERQAASVVRSMDDVIERQKYLQVLSAAESACEYAGKADFLDAVGKLDLGGNDLISDAESIAAALGYNCADLL